ncbi:purine nucleoside permease [Sphingomonas crocodyli]|uniref:Purine nucleoside permease n=2 Tax=Sphingomonas crocodyli TaxID=1979270 RepID=A0A437LUS6_9SPHN|nr:purine nucleoside permease [Sphingomonas crocodyli]
MTGVGERPPAGEQGGPMEKVSQRNIVRRQLLAAAALSFAWIAPAQAAEPAAPLPIRMVIVTAFEIGADTGDKAGEFQAWATVMPDKIAFPMGFRDLRYDAKKQALLLSTGVGTNRAAASTMALGLDPRFDLSKAYWMIAAIAGVNPNEASLGSAAWIGDVIDSDYGYAVDVREAPKGWTAGQWPRDRTQPYEMPRSPETSYNLFPVNKGLRDWAYTLTANVKLADTPDLQKMRATYTGFPKAMEPPKVIKGDEITGQTFWHGALLNAHFEKWTKYWAGDNARFAMTAMEDSGVIQSIKMLAKSGKADPQRVLVLRTGSNYSMPSPASGLGAAESLNAENSGGYSGLQPSLDAAFIVGGKVVDEITGHWDRYRDTTPGATAGASAAGP